MSKFALRLIALRPFALVSLAVIVWISPATTSAQEWSFDPQLAAGIEIDDNAQLTTRTDDIVKLNGYLLSADADIVYQSKATRFLFTPLILDRNYPDDDQFDSTMYDAQLRYNYRTSRQRFRIDGSFNQDDIRNAERADIDLDETDPDNIPDDDTGLVQLRGDRDRLTIRPSWAYNWSDAASTVLRVDYRNVSYDQALLLIDYTDTIVTADYRVGFSDRSAWFMSGSLERYKLEQDLGEFDATAINFGFESQLSPKLRMRFRLGAEKVESSVSGLNETSPIGELTFVQKLETIDFFAQYRRSVTASGNGRMSERDAIHVKLGRELSERFGVGLGLLAYSSDPIQLGPDSSPFGRNYAQLEARFTWRITRSFALETMYRYTFADREIQGESANSNQVIALIVYSPNAGEEDLEVGELR